MSNRNIRNVVGLLLCVTASLFSLKGVVFAADFSFDGSNFSMSPLDVKVSVGDYSDLGFDVNGNMYVLRYSPVPQSDTRALVLKVTPSDTVSTVYSGVYPWKSSDFDSSNIYLKTKNWRHVSENKYTLNDQRTAIIKTNARGEKISADIGPCFTMQGFDVDDSGNVYVDCSWVSTPDTNLKKITFPDNGFPTVSKIPVDRTIAASYLYYGPAIDKQGNIYIAGGYYDSGFSSTGVKVFNGNGTDRSNKIIKITPQGVSSEFAKTGDNPVSIAIDGNGYIYTFNQYSNTITLISKDGKSTEIMVDPSIQAHSFATGKNSIYLLGDRGSLAIRSVAPPVNNKPFLTFTSDKNHISKGSSVTFFWKADNVDTCSIRTNINRNTGSVGVCVIGAGGPCNSVALEQIPVSGSVIKSPTENTTYDLVCRNQDGSNYISKGIQVFVDTVDTINSNDEDKTVVNDTCTDLTYYMSIAFTRSLTAITYTRTQSTDANTGGQVTDLQTFLKDQGFMDQIVTTTGRYGSMTAKAVKAFQVKYNLSQTGATGPLTRAKIKAVSCN